MTTVVLAFVGMLIVVAIMAIGVVFGRKPIAGSCGGIAQLGSRLGLDGECQICGRKPQDCPEDNDPDLNKLAYPAKASRVSD